MKRIEGFQLVEMLLIVTILAILMSFSAPHIARWYQATLAEHLAYRLQDSINSARLRALQERARVVICPLANNTCHTDWQQGWSVFVDTNNNQRLDGAEQALHYALGSTVVQLGFRSRVYRYISMAATGTSNFTSIYVCGLEGHSYYRVVVNRSGRARVEADENTACTTG